MPELTPEEYALIITAITLCVLLLGYACLIFKYYALKNKLEWHVLKADSKDIPNYSIYGNYMLYQYHLNSGSQSAAITSLRMSLNASQTLFANSPYEYDPQDVVTVENWLGYLYNFIGTPTPGNHINFHTLLLETAKRHRIDPNKWH